MSAAPATSRRRRELTLVDVLDRLLEGGVALHGDLTLAAADIDLVRLDLRMLLRALTGSTGEASPGRHGTASTRTPARPAPSRRVKVDDDSPERGLAQLVLAVVELLRQLMERQAVRRAHAGGLTEEETERLGRTFMALQDRMEELKATFGLTDEDLSLGLGVHGELE